MRHLIGTAAALLALSALLAQGGAQAGPAATPAAQAPDAAALFQANCASCHGSDRLGGMGPALLPENLERLRRPEALSVIRNGRPATQMPGFADQLSEAEVKALAEYVYAPPPVPPVWDYAEIRASRLVHVKGALPAKPKFRADPQNLFIVVELGDHHATLLDGDRFEPIDRFQTRFALHGGPKFSPDGRFVYFASRDGWISRYDIYNLKTTHEIRAGINTRNLAVSDDGKYVLVGNYLPHTLVVLNAEDLSLVKVLPVKTAEGKSSRVSAVYQAAPRQSFVVALKDVPEVWEIPYAVPAKKKGWVHDFGPDSGEMTVGSQTFKPRRLLVEDYLDDFFFDQGYKHLIGASRQGKQGQVIDLDTGKQVSALDLPGMPHLGSGITWEYQGRPVMATPNLKDWVVSIIDMQTWKTIKQIPTQGPGFFMRSHENTPYAWVDGMNGPNRDVMTVIDKRTLEVAAAVRPEPGKTASHVEFTRDGRYALISIWEQDGALVVYDAATLKEVKRLPMRKPSGKYNVFNKTTRSAGTSH